MPNNSSNITEKTEDTIRWCELVIYLEIGYQIVFFVIGTPINLVNLLRDVRLLRAARLRLRTVGDTRTLHIALHLTVSNLVVLSMCAAKTTWQLTYFWYGGDFLCKMYKFIGSFAYHSWSNIIVLIAVDMWYCMQSPLKSVSEGSRRIRIWLAIAWILSIIFSAPQVYLNGLIFVPPEYRPQSSSHNDSLYQCVYLFDQHVEFSMGYSLYHTIVIFYIPLCVIIVAYAGIRKSVASKLRTRNDLFGAEESRHSQNSSVILPKQSIQEGKRELVRRFLLSKTHNASAPKGFFKNHYSANALLAGHSKASPKAINRKLSHRRPTSASVVSFEQNGFDIDQSIQERKSMISRASSRNVLSKISNRAETEKSKGSRASTKRRLLQMTLLVVLSYVLCWTPYQINALSRCICGLLDIKACASFFCNFEWLEGILILGACLNPFLYRFKGSKKSANTRDYEISTKARHSEHIL